MHDDPTRRMEVPPAPEEGGMSSGIKAVIAILIAAVLGLGVALAVVSGDSEGAETTAPIATTQPTTAELTTATTTTTPTTTEPTTTATTATTTTATLTTSTATDLGTTTEGSGGTQAP